MIHESKLEKLKNINIICDHIDEYELFLKALNIDGIFFIHNAELNLVNVFYEYEKKVNLNGWTREQHYALENSIRKHKKEMYKTKEDMWKNIIKDITGKNIKECLEHFKYVSECVLETKKKESKIQDIEHTLFRFDYMPLNFNKSIVLLDCINGEFKYIEEDYILILYKFEQLLFSFELSMEETYQKLLKLFKNLDIKKVYFATYDLQCCFNLLSFAEYYEKKFKIPINELTNKLWGNNYFSSKSGWSTVKSNPNQERSFCNLILSPICKLYNAINLKDDIKIDKMLETLNLKVDNKYSFDHVLNKWFPIQDIIIRDFLGR